MSKERMIPDEIFLPKYWSENEFSTLPREYWPCPLCLITLLRAHGEGVIDHRGAYVALQNSGLVEPWPGEEGRVQTTAKGRKFVEMLLEVPLPIQEWIDPRACAPKETK